jgi:hypothetical protein
MSRAMILANKAAGLGRGRGYGTAFYLLLMLVVLVTRVPACLSF